jgi:hexulose-6-phosphate isomerase
MDVYYEPSDQETRRRFIEGLRWAVDQAARSQVTLAVENMDTPLINSITAWQEYAKIIESPFFCVYPDLGNLSAWNNDVPEELRKGVAKTVAIHLKDTLRVTDVPRTVPRRAVRDGLRRFPDLFQSARGAAVLRPVRNRNVVG